LKAKNKKIVVDTGPLARVEGEGSLLIETDGRKSVNIQLNIFEPPRYYEAFLKGRKAEEVVDIVPRICGICPVAHQISALNAFEGLFGVPVDDQVRRVRRLLYLGEWIESHALHVFMLAAPDFLGVPDSLVLAKKNPDLVKKALMLKRAGNELMAVIGGREIHPVSPRIGGLHKAPKKDSLTALRPQLERSLEFAKDAVSLTSSLDIPPLERDVVFVALKRRDEYAITDGRIVSNRGLDVEPNEYEKNFEEHQAAYSHALRSLTKDGLPYMVGPLARVNLNFDQLNPLARDRAKEVGFGRGETNPFKSIVARSIELLHAVQEAIEQIELYQEPTRPYNTYEYKEGVGYGVSEAPRGLLYHRYEVDRRGFIVNAKIVPPTAQNQVRIEEDIRLLAPAIISAKPHEARRLSEMAVRNYDPCISCATHFLKLNIKRV